MTNLMTIVSYQPQLPPPLDESGQITMTIVSFGSNLRPHKMNLTMVVIYLGSFLRSQAAIHVVDMQVNPTLQSG